MTRPHAMSSEPPKLTIPGLFREIGLGTVSLVQGLHITLLHLFRRKVTLHYPHERPVLAPRFRGLHGLTANPEGDLNCTGCNSCARVCPDHVITIETEKREGHKGRYPVEFEIDLNSCCFCGLCTEACPTPLKALVMTKQYELAVTERADLVLTRERLLENGRREVEEHGYVEKPAKGKKADKMEKAA